MIHEFSVININVNDSLTEFGELTEANEDKPYCFGILENVFPKTEDGLRETPESCLLTCRLKTECLRTAITKSPEAAKAQEERVDQAYEAGMLSFVERWSRKKQLKRKKKKGKKANENN